MAQDACRAGDEENGRWSSRGGLVYGSLQDFGEPFVPLRAELSRAAGNL
ncbi:MAG: hypothetical protein V3T92_04540 [Anaerolineae bacterium]